VLQLTGRIRIDAFVASVFLFLLVLIIAVILAGVGGMFLGVFVAHRMLAQQDFTPFEKEMLAMRQEVRELKALLEEMRAPGGGRAKP
jgi:uncharacterized protein YneF (UPF0154 family)